MSRHLPVAVAGVTLGVVISWAGFTDWGEVHRMFSLGVGMGGPSLENLRLVLAFAGAVGLSVVAFRLFAWHDAIPSKPIRGGTVPGAILFGAGWAICGACPAGALAQLGEGKVLAVVTLAAVLAGAWLHDALRKRLGWARHSCID